VAGGFRRVMNTVAAISEAPEIKLILTHLDLLGPCTAALASA